VYSQELLHFDGLYGDIQGNFSAEYIFLELIATRSQIFEWAIKPHIHSHLFQVFIIEKGTLVFEEAMQQHTLQAPCILLIPPTMLHGLYYKPNVEGSIFTISESIIEEIFKTSPHILQDLKEIQILVNFEEDTDFRSHLDLIKKIDLELFSDNQERKIMLKAYITQLFISLYRLSSQNTSPVNISSINMSYFRKFIQSIKSSNFRKSIPEYADELHITSVHLNRICKSVSGKSAIDLVHQNIISEAQKYLLHTSYSVSEIAYILEFEYPNYFAKFFKKYVGKSPNDFRKEDRK